MILVIEPYNAEKYSYLLEQMFRLRARLIRDRLTWGGVVTGGKERDRYDDENPVYVIYTDEDRLRLQGSFRLLPTTGPTVSADLFSDTDPDAAHLMAPTIWECTRFCLGGDAWHKDRAETAFASTVLLVALGDLALRAGIESIIGVFDSSMLHSWRRIGYDVEVLGSTSRSGRPLYLGLHPVSKAIVNRIKERLTEAPSVFAEAREVAA